MKKWALDGLKQKQHGIIDVSEFKHLLTPIIWASFITGAPPEVHGIKSWWSVSNNSGLDSFLYWVVYNVPIIKNLSRQQLRNIGKIFGIQVRPPQESDLTRKGLTNIFQVANKPVVVDVPSYNETADTRERYSKAMELGFSNYEREREILKIHDERVGRIFSQIDTDWDLFMVWIDLVDQMGHLHMGRDMKKMAKSYLSCEVLAERIRKQIGPDATLMIVSDHGMTTVDNIPAHGSMAYYSFNNKVDWEPKSILDYADFIKKYIKD